jgi:hypothetical protein
MKNIAIACLMLMAGSVALARDLDSQITITKGPFYVPVTNDVFNVLGPDFSSEGKILVYTTDASIDFLFPRMDFVSLPSVEDTNTPGYYYSHRVDGQAQVRVGFEDEKLAWFYSTGGSIEWKITITKDAQNNLVAPTPFSKMTRDQLLELAQRLVDDSNVGLLENFKWSKSGKNTIVTADVLQGSENTDDFEVVGTATLTFVDKKGARTIELKGSVIDLK